MGLEQLSLVKQATANMDGITTITEINGQLLHGTLPDNPARIHQSRPRRAEHHSARAPLQLRDDGIDHHLGATLVSIYDEVRNLAVQGIALGHQVPKHLFRIRRLQQGPLAILGGTLELLLDTGAQIDHQPVFTQDRKSTRLNSSHVRTSYA